MPTIRPHLLLAAAATTAALALMAAPALAGPSTGLPAAAPPSTPAPPIPSQQPGPPTDLRVTAVTPTSITLAWTAAPGDVAGYSISYNQAFNDVYWQQPVGDVTTVTITSSIRPTFEYRLSVSARDSGGRLSAAAGPVVVVTPAGTTGDTTPPAKPTDLRITSYTATGPALAWSPATDDTALAGYDVFFFDGWFTSTKVGTTTGTTFQAPAMSSGTGRNYYYVRARDTAGNLSIASNLVQAAGTPTPTPPQRTCTVAYRTTAEWHGGFVAEVRITNTGATAVDNWTLTFPPGGDQRVTSAWNATVSQSATGITLTAPRWDRSIAPGATVTAGLIGRWTASNAAPPSAALNGVACTLT